MRHRRFLYGSSFLMLAWFPLKGVASEPPPAYEEKPRLSDMPSEFYTYNRVQVRNLLTGGKAEVLASNRLLQAVPVEVEAGGCFRRRNRRECKKEIVKSTLAAGGYFTTWVSRAPNTVFGMGLSGKEHGCEITSIAADSPIEQRGLSVGDRLVAIDGLWTGTMTLEDIGSYFRNKQENRITLLVHRGSPAAPIFSPIISTDSEKNWGLFKIQIEEKVRDAIGLTIATTGAASFIHWIVDSLPTGDAAKAGCKVGDRIEAVNDQNISSLNQDEVFALFTKSRLQGEPITILVSRKVGVQ